MLTKGAPGELNKYRRIVVFAVPGSPGHQQHSIDYAGQASHRSPQRKEI